MCFAEVSVCGRRQRSGVERLMNGGSVAKIRGCDERASERTGGREETRTRTTQELNRRGDEALTFGGVQGVKEREV